MPEGKQRHGCLGVYLLLMIILNGVSALLFLYSGGSSRQALSGDVPHWILGVGAAASAFNVVCAIALHQWRKWGFWGFCASAAVMFVTNVVLGVGALSVLGLMGVPVLYGVLHIGQQNKGWPQLE